MKSMARDLPSLQLQPVDGPPASNLSLKGGGYLPGEAIVAKDLATGAALCTTTATKDGAFSCSAKVPAKAQCGKLAISALGQRSREATLRKFTVRCPGASWSIQATPVSDGYLVGISCSAASACTAIGVNGSNHQALVERWNGTQWSVQSTPTSRAACPASRVRRRAPAPPSAPTRSTATRRRWPSAGSAPSGRYRPPPTAASTPN